MHKVALVTEHVAKVRCAAKVFQVVQDTFGKVVNLKGFVLLAVILLDPFRVDLLVGAV